MKLCKVFFRALLCGMFALCLVFGGLSVFAYSGSAPQEKTDGANLRVMSYNVLVDNDESLGGWSWGQPLGNRGDKASACINYYQPDVIGFQECNYKWHVSLRKNLPDYDFVNADVPEEQPLEKAESLGKKDWMCTTMMYNTKTLKLIENELIGYTVNYWGCIQRMRYASMAVFEIKASGERFTFFSTHLDAEQDEKGQRMRMTQSDELAAIIKEYKSTYGHPVIGTGDFNSKFADEPIQNIVSKAGMTSSVNNRSGIDYVLFSAGVVGKSFTIVKDNDVLGASDHAPVFADLLLQDYHFKTTKATGNTTTSTTTSAPQQGPGVVITKNTTKSTAPKGTTASTAKQTESTAAPTDGAGETDPTDSTAAPTGNETAQDQQPTDPDGAVGIIGGADGPTAIGITSSLPAGLLWGIIGGNVLIAGAIVATILLMNKKK